MVSADLTFRPVTSSDVPLLIQWDAEDHVASAAGDPIFNSFDWEEEIRKNPPWREMYMAETHDGISIGYMDTSKVINNLKTERASLDEIAKFIGFD